MKTLLPLRVLPIGLLWLALAACGTTGMQPQPQAAAVEGQETEMSTEWVTVTGSRLRRPVDPETGLPLPGSDPLTFYSRRGDFKSTGEQNVYDAIILLDPRFFR